MGEAAVTPYGMEWKVDDATATIVVERVAYQDGYGIIGVTAKAPGMSAKAAPSVQISVSPGGRSIRVWNAKTGQEMMAQADKEDPR